MDNSLQIVPARKNVEAQYVEMRVPLYSYGCERKIKKALSHLKGIYSVNVDFTQQKVTVWGICNKFDVLSTIKKKRIGACFWNHEDNLETSFISQLGESKSTATSPIIVHPPKRSTSFNLTKSGSLRLKLAWKNVFLRSFSFS